MVESTKKPKETAPSERVASEESTLDSREVFLIRLPKDIEIEEETLAQLTSDQKYLGKLPFEFFKHGGSTYFAYSAPISTGHSTAQIISETFDKVFGVLGSRDKALRWMGTPVRGLGFATPISLLGTTEGAQQVTDILTQIEHGVWQAVTVYRICRAKYPQNDGAGAALGGGRWNHKGTAILYCASTASLCALEVLVHSEDLPEDRVVIAAIIPDDISIETISDADLPADWKADIHPHSTRNYGTEWAARKRSAVLSVPSAVVPDERNYLLNPVHPDSAKIKFSNPKPFVFDLRLK